MIFALGLFCVNQHLQTRVLCPAALGYKMEIRLVGCLLRQLDSVGEVSFINSVCALNHQIVVQHVIKGPLALALRLVSDRTIASQLLGGFLIDSLTQLCV